MQILA